MTIGPHEGRELALMLAGQKKLAAFGDVIPENNVIHEVIIPEQAFEPYVKTGKIIRLEKHIKADDGNMIRYVCFTLPDEEWRAEAYFWIREKNHHNVFPADQSVDTMIGRLLGYDEADIADFNSQF